MTGLDAAQPLSEGEWSAALVDKATATELPLEKNGWRGSMGLAENAVSEASIVLDADYAEFIGRRPLLWTNEVVLYRDGLLSWIGPVTGIDDEAEGGVVWSCQDRMAMVLNRRWFWRSGTYSGDLTNLMTVALNAADFGDPTGLIREPIDTGIIAAMPAVAGNKIGDAIAALGISWTVVGETIRYGAINQDTGLDLTPESWGINRPTIEADGFQRLTHVCAVTDQGARIFYPSSNPADRPPGSPLLVDTIDVGAVDAPAARELARLAWISRQGELSIIPESDRPVGPEFPLQWPWLIPGLVMAGTPEGQQLTADRIPVKVTEVNAEMADSIETSVTVAVAEAPRAGLADAELAAIVQSSIGTIFPPGQVYPSTAPGGDVDWEAIGIDPLTDPVPLDGIDWEDLDLGPEKIRDPGGESGPDPDIIPIKFPTSDPGEIPTGIGPFPDPIPVDPFADCPPAHCCDQCSFEIPVDGDENIWLCTDLAAGASTWTSVGGDVRNLIGQGPETLSPGGYQLAPDNIITEFNSSILNTAGATTWDNAGGMIEYVMEISQNWQKPGGRTNANQMRGGAGTFAFVSMENWDGANPADFGIQSNAIGADLADLIEVDTSAISLTDYAKVFLRVQYTPTTGAVDVHISPDGSVWTLAGSRTWDTLPSDPSKTLAFAADAAPGSTASNLGPTVVHSFSASQVGGDSHSFTLADFATAAIVMPANARETASIAIGSCTLQRDKGGLSYAATMRDGAPLYCHWTGGIRDSTSEAIFDGADLEDPAIAAAWGEDPSYIQVITGVQPSVFTGVASTYGAAETDQHALVWAVCDRATFTDIDANGWPTDWFPFGTRVM